MNHAKIVVWPRIKESDSNVDVNGKRVYRYCVVGMIVTDKPIKSLDCNEIVIDGQLYGIEDVLDMANKREPNRKLGDAINVLADLGSV